MKILFIANGFPSHRWAGTETYTAAIAGGLQTSGHDVQVLCAGEWEEGPNHWNGFRDDVHNNIPVRRLDLNWKRSSDPFRYLYANPVVAGYLADYLDDVRPDLVHVSSCETLSASILGVVKKRRIPLVLSITDFWFICPRITLLRSDGENCSGVTTAWDCLSCLARDSVPYGWAKKVMPRPLMRPILTMIGNMPPVTRQRGFRGMWGNVAARKEYLRHAFSLPDVRMVASHFVKNIYETNGFDNPVKFHPYGHDLTWLAAYHGKLPSETINIGFIGQIVHFKGVHLLVDAARRLANELGKKVKFLIYGDLQKDPAYTKQLKLLADGLDTVQFCGTYAHEKSAEVYSKIDVLVVPSLWYDFPLIIHEAFATQTPVIAANIGSIAEAVIHGHNGLLFERGNIVDLTSQIRKIVNDHSLRQKLIDGIREVKSVEEETAELEETYQGLLSSLRKS